MSVWRGNWDRLFFFSKRLAVFLRLLCRRLHWLLVSYVGGILGFPFWTLMFLDDSKFVISGMGIFKTRSVAVLSVWDFVFVSFFLGQGNVSLIGILLFLFFPRRWRV